MSKKSTSKKTTKISKKTAKATKRGAPKFERLPHIEFKPNTVVARTNSKRDKGGPKSQLLEMVPKKGITVARLTSLAKKADLPVKKVPHYLAFLRTYRHIQARV